MFKGPCKENGVDCPERKLGCHDHCERYQAFKAGREAYLASVREKKDRERDYWKSVSQKHRR